MTDTEAASEAEAASGSQATGDRADIVTDPMTGAEANGDAAAGATNGDAGEPVDFELIEALFFAYREFISSADRDLAAMGFGRAHHRVLHFVNRAPGLSVAELLEPLGITKQSLARVLRQLVEAGLIAQRRHGDDRRQRHLYPTRAGRALTLRLAGPQSRRIGRSLERMGTVDAGEARQLVAAFLKGMVDAPDGAANGEP